MFYVKVSKSRKSLGVNADETLFKVFRLLVNDLLKYNAISLSNLIQGKKKYISILTSYAFHINNHNITNITTNRIIARENKCYCTYPSFSTVWLFNLNFLWSGIETSYTLNLLTNDKRPLIPKTRNMKRHDLSACLQFFLLCS